MMIVRNWNPRVLRIFCAFLFPFKTVSKLILVFQKRVSRTLATIYVCLSV